jgi:hypothetical protein
MPLLLALGITNVLSSTYWNKKTIDGGELQPQAMGTDARNVGVIGGLAATALGAVIGVPLLVAVGLGVATSSFVNKDTTTRVAEGLKTWIKDETNKAIAARMAAPQIEQQPPPAPAPAQLPQQPGFERTSFNAPDTRAGRTARSALAVFNALLPREQSQAA